MRFSTFLLALCLGLALSLNGSSAFAQVPRMLHYQATLAENDVLIDEPVDLAAAFFADSTGGTPLANWTESRTGVPVTAGRISLLLGSQTPLPDSLFTAPALYLQLTVNGTPFPRVQVASTAYALRARIAEGVPAGRISADAIADGAVTSTKLAAGAVAADRLADGAVTSAKLGASAVVGDVLADGAVTTSKLANGAVTAPKIATGALVSSLNNLTDAIRLVGGDNVTITPNADAGTITISADDDDFPSSRRWKTNIQSLDGLALVRQLRGVRYNWIEDGAPDVGLIAEEVGVVVPEVVTYAPNGVDAESVSYAKLVALLIEAVKEQQAQIEADRARLHALQTRIEALERATATRPTSAASEAP